MMAPYPNLFGLSSAISVPNFMLVPQNARFLYILKLSTCTIRNIAQETDVAAEKDYNDSVRDTLLGTTNSYKWWSTLRTTLFGVDVAVPPLLRPNGSLSQATLFADVFDGKQSNGSLTMPQSCLPEVKLTTFAFHSGEVKKLLLELEPYDGAGPDDIFPLFFVKTANYLAPKISTVLRKLVRIGGFSMCWRVGNIAPVLKSGIASSCPSDYRPITITPVLSKVFERLLAKRLKTLLRRETSSQIYSLVSAKDFISLLVLPF